MKERLFILIQYLLPHHLLSRTVHFFIECTYPKFKNALIRRMIKQYDINMTEAIHEHPKSYAHFNDFFTRPLKKCIHPMPKDPSLVISPADGQISQLGNIKDGRIFQAKGHDYSLIELLGGDSKLGKEFTEGKFATVYLSPRDYHRIHTPFGGALRKMIYVPGRLFSVNPLTVKNIPNLFVRNERVVVIYDTNYGPMAVVMVGAMIVASIETVWFGLVRLHRRQVYFFDYGEHTGKNITLARGEEMGRFKIGSTAVVLFGKDKIEWLEQWHTGSHIKMGQAIAAPV